LKRETSTLAFFDVFQMQKMNQPLRGRQNGQNDHFCKSQEHKFNTRYQAFDTGHQTNDTRQQAFGMALATTLQMCHFGRLVTDFQRVVARKPAENGY
jgi:hypothetical protein